MHLHLLQQDRLVRLGLGVAGEHDGSSVGGGQMHIDHVHCCHLVQHRSRRQPGRQRPRPLLQRDNKWLYKLRVCRRLHSLRRWSHDEEDLQSTFPEVGDRAVRMVLEHGNDHPSQWAAISSIASKIGCTGETLRKWARQAERDRGQ